MQKLKSLSEIPNIIELVNAGKVTYRGMGFGKEGTRIRVNGKEHVISTKDFATLGGISKMRFFAPVRK